MSSLPDFLKPFQNVTAQYFVEDRIKDIEFSGGTYQVQMIDAVTQKEVWAFLQLDKRGQIRDSFCSCEEGEDIHYCVHQAVAFLRIYNGHISPLHQRFERSLWNTLCKLYAQYLGYRPNLLKRVGKGKYRSTSDQENVKLSIKGNTEEGKTRIEEIICNRQKETEETSLKFSNLSLEEITQWKEGRPTAQLQYGLSFWNDLAKWLMLLQDKGEEYEITFDFSPARIPNQINIHFPDVDLSFLISEDALISLVPTLTTVKSPLTVYHGHEEEIESIVYEKEKGSLKIVHKTLPADFERKKKSMKEKGILMGGWIYVKDDGFYPKDRHSLLSASELTGKEIETVLNDHSEVVKSFIKGTAIHEDILQASYSLFFDEEWNLHLAAYLFTPGDLSQDFSKKFGKWVYLDNEGFYRIEGLRFEKEEIVVAAKDVGAFVSQNRTFFNIQEGFSTHLINFESTLTYQLSSDSRLSFNQTLAIFDKHLVIKDFDEWIYVAGHGFYAKTSSKVSLPLHFSIPSNQIPIFIRMHRDELQFVNGFFSEKCPLAKASLSIELIDKNTIAVTPRYELLSEYEGKDVRFFDDYTYVKDEGFCEIPPHLRLPDEYQHAGIIQDKDLTPFLDQKLTTLMPYVGTIDSRLVKPKKIELITELITKIEAEEKQWYGLKLKYETEKGKVSVPDLWDSLKKKNRFVFSDAGLIDLADERYSWLKRLNKDKINRKSQLTRLSPLELLRLHALESIVLKSDKDLSESKNVLAELTEFRLTEKPDLSGLKSILRPYQELSVQWLWFLYCHQLSGLLCDDMGLGKTHQAMGLLAAVANSQAKQSKKSRFLIICPTSVIYHWQEKLHDFFPSLRVLTFYGAGRSLEEFYEEYDILLTSYGIWRNEVDQLKNQFFEVAIFDEIQIAKNYQSRIHSTLLKTHAGMRLGLTGTPIENRIRELKSLFDLVLPSYMPGEAEYRDFFIRPIEKEGNKERQYLLSKLIKPFVMRRKKEDVLLDLPEKIEEIAHCDLIGEQYQLYVDTLISSRQKILDTLDDERNPIPYVHIFALLSHLKQICDHPAAFYKKADTYKKYPSGKWELFIELLREARESQQKVVVFSHYLTMLDIIQEYLKEHGIGFAAIRGSTLNRGEQIKRFNQDPKCEVFVASLQAAGLGVDLTAGSVVIHYDRWWNAARENQATDRVHRIGQTRGVQVFKLVTKNTVEEHIDNLIAKKGKLMEEVVGIDDHQILKKFNRQEIIDLLRLVPS